MGSNEGGNPPPPMVVSSSNTSLGQPGPVLVSEPPLAPVRRRVVCW